MAQDKIALNVSEAAKLIGVSQTTIYKMVNNGEIPHARVRSRIIFHKGVVEDWLRGNTLCVKEA
jgi:excisionase family DNA binding protein